MKVKVAKLKRIISAKDNRVKKAAQPKPVTRNLQQQASNLFFSHNKLTPPFSVLIDTNFINFSLQNKLNIEQAMMDCLYAKCVPHVTDCVIAELYSLIIQGEDGRKMENCSWSRQAI